MYQNEFNEKLTMGGIFEEEAYKIVARHLSIGSDEPILAFNSANSKIDKDAARGQTVHVFDFERDNQRNVLISDFMYIAAYAGSRVRYHVESKVKEKHTIIDGRPCVYVDVWKVNEYEDTAKKFGATQAFVVSDLEVRDVYFLTKDTAHFRQLNFLNGSNKKNYNNEFYVWFLDDHVPIAKWEPPVDSRTNYERLKQAMRDCVDVSHMLDHDDVEITLTNGKGPCFRSALSNVQYDKLKRIVIGMANQTYKRIEGALKK